MRSSGCCARCWRRRRSASSARRLTMLTVESLTAELGLKIAAGAKVAGEHPIRWVHISELADPTPWLNGGELLLTTGIQLDTAKQQREFVRLLAGAELAGLGLGTGFNHKKLPKALVAEAESAGFPVFEVPYEMPFIAITEAAFTPPREEPLHRPLQGHRGQQPPRAPGLGRSHLRGGRPGNRFARRRRHGVVRR